MSVVRNPSVPTTEIEAARIAARRHVLGPADKRRVLEHVEELCASAEFSRSERMISFLRFVIGAALDGRSEDLRERMIGEQVFDRAADWDPSGDTIVRTEARRLRTKLETYYQRPGNQGPVRIDLPKGGYVPKFIIDPSPAFEGVSAPTTQFYGYRMVVVIVGALLIITVAGAMIWMRRSAAKAAASIEHLSTTTPFTSEPGKEYSPAISPDEKTVAYVWDGDKDEPDIYLKSIENGKTVHLPGSSGVRIFPTWSPDGGSLAYLRSEGDQLSVIVQRLDGGAETTLTKITREVGHWSGDESPLLGDPGPAWTRDGTAVVVADRNREQATGGLYRVSLGGVREQLTSTSGEVHDLYPSMSPDGTKLAFVRYSSHGRSELYIMPLAGGTPARLTSDHKAIRGIAWSRTGDRLVYSSNRSGSFQLWLQILAGGPPQELITNSSSASEPALSYLGDWLVYVESNENWNIWRRRIDGDRLGSPEKLIASSGRNYDARYSPDGQTIAFVSDRSGTMQIWRSKSDGSDPIQLTHLPDSWIGGISWSPDAAWIAFDGRPEGHSSIFIMPAGGGAPRLLESNIYEERMPTWAHDGKSIYFSSVRDGGMAVWQSPLTGGPAQRVSDSGIFASSANAQYLYYSSRGGQIWRASLHGEDPRRLPKEVEAMPVMSWYLSGDTIYFSRADPHNSNQYEFLRNSSGKITHLGHSAQRLVPNAPDIAVSPDGNWLLYAQEDISSSDLKLRRASAEMRVAR
jgi:Tol biopolymer transport system component